MMTEKQVIDYAKALAEKFIWKCENGRARSRETLAECHELLRKIAQYERKKS